MSKPMADGVKALEELGTSQCHKPTARNVKKNQDIEHIGTQFGRLPSLHDANDTWNQPGISAPGPAMFMLRFIDGG